MKNVSSRRAKALQISSFVRLLVSRRDDGLCVYCRRPGNPEAHFIPRSKGGLGVPQNILTLCRECHDKYDFGAREEREGMREYFREYLSSKYDDWSEEKLIYHKEVLR